FGNRPRKSDLAQARGPRLISCRDGSRRDGMNVRRTGVSMVMGCALSFAACSSDHSIIHDTGGAEDAAAGGKKNGAGGGRSSGGEAGSGARGSGGAGNRDAGAMSSGGTNAGTGGRTSRDGGQDASSSDTSHPGVDASTSDAGTDGGNGSG